MLTILGIIFMLFVELFFPLMLPAFVIFLMIRKVVTWSKKHPKSAVAHSLTSI